MEKAVCAEIPEILVITRQASSYLPPHLCVSVLLAIRLESLPDQELGFIRGPNSLSEAPPPEPRIVPYKSEAPSMYFFYNAEDDACSSLLILETGKDS